MSQATRWSKENGLTGRRDESTKGVGAMCRAGRSLLNGVAGDVTVDTSTFHKTRPPVFDPASCTIPRTVLLKVLACHENKKTRAYLLRDPQAEHAQSTPIPLRKVG